jgi:hypothetical protein
MMHGRLDNEFVVLALVAAAVLATPALLPAEEHKAGAARVVITPDLGVWMSGYASRDKPAEGKVHELYAKALALEDARGQRLVLVTTDLVGLPRDLSEAVASAVQKQTGLPRDRLLLTSSHTHCGPVVRGNLMDMYDLDAEQRAKIERYAEELRTRMIRVVADALADLKPAELALGTGTARFAVNRRQPTEKGVINGIHPTGPVDHSVPVLRVKVKGELRAVVFGYACHNTTLQFFQWCGDYAGFAQANLEERHPGAVALFWSGCGADANPLPRGTVELCKKYGQELADAVETVLAGTLTPVKGDFQARYAVVPLPLGALPGRDRFVADLLSKNRAARVRAEKLLKILDAGGKIEESYPHYPIQVWRLGDQVVWVALGGEVVVDYALRLKKELGQQRPLWVTAYANDVMAYIPSVRVLKEGGYEADSSMIFYGLPTKWAPEIEEIIVKKVHALVQDVQQGASRP